MDKLHTLAKLLWVTGGVLCLMVFVYQATPILLSSLTAAWLQPTGVFLIFLGLCILSLCTIFLFAWMFVELGDRWHFLRIRKRMRELDILTREQELQHTQKYSRYRTHHASNRQGRHILWRRFKRGKP